MISLENEPKTVDIAVCQVFQLKLIIGLSRGVCLNPWLVWVQEVGKECLGHPESDSRYG